MEHLDPWVLQVVAVSVVGDVGDRRRICCDDRFGGEPLSDGHETALHLHGENYLLWMGGGGLRDGGVQTSMSCCGDLEIALDLHHDGGGFHLWMVGVCGMVVCVPQCLAVVWHAFARLVAPYSVARGGGGSAGRCGVPMSTAIGGVVGVYRR